MQISVICIDDFFEFFLPNIQKHFIRQKNKSPEIPEPPSPASAALLRGRARARVGGGGQPPALRVPRLPRHQGRQDHPELEVIPNPQSGSKLI